MEIWGSLGPPTGALQKLGTPWGPWGKHKKELTADFTPGEVPLTESLQKFGALEAHSKSPLFSQSPSPRALPCCT
jgi:hypothetical protein